MQPYLLSRTLAILLVCTGAALSACDPGADKKKVIAECDILASHPRDPGRRSAGVPDAQVAVGAAVDACLAATKQDPSSARSWFQLGRSYWLGQRYEDAVIAYAEAAERNYAPAMKAIGDAYLEGKGVPKADSSGPTAATRWYKKSAAAGFEDGRLAVAEMEKQTLDPSLFNRPAFISMMYNGEFTRLDAPLTFIIYVSAFNEELGGEKVSFIDQNCTPLVTLGGSLALEGGSWLSLIKLLKNKQGFADAGMALLSAPLIEDEGHRDAFILINKYHCDSYVAKRILGNTNLSYQKIREILRELSLSKN